jgi:TonB-dependent SusC/RagA subfamily outer membrane receptor
MTGTISSLAPLRVIVLAAAVLLAGPLRAQVTRSDSATRGRWRDSSHVTVSTIHGSALNAVPSFTLEQALQGKVAGMIVNMNDGAPWSDGQIQIRGVSTLWGDPSPLVLVDGVQTTNSFAATADEAFSLNTGVRRASTADLAGFTPFEIERVEVLKGPVATSLYGARGAQGVLLITTRRASNGPSRWRAMMRSGRGEAMRLPSGRCFSTVAEARVVSPRDSLAIIQIAAANGGVLPCRSHVADYFRERALSTESALQWSGGWSGTEVFASVARKSAPGSFDRSGTTRTNVRLNIDQRLLKRLTAKLSLGQSTIDVARGGGSAYAVETLQLYPTWSDPRLPRLYAFPDAVVLSPYAVLGGGRDDGDANRVTSSLKLEYDAYHRGTTSIHIEYLGGIDWNNQGSRTSGDYQPRNASSDSVTSTSRESVRSHLDNHALRARIKTSKWSGVPVTVETGLTLDRQRYQQKSSASLFGVGTSAQSYIARSSIRGAYAAASAALLDESLELTASIRNDRIADWGTKSPVATYPSVGVVYRTPLPPTGPAISLRGAWGVSGSLGAMGTRPFLVQAVSFDGPLTQHFERRREIEGGIDIASSGRRTMLAYTAYRADSRSVYGEYPITTVNGTIRTLQPDLAAIRTTGHEITLSQSIVRNTRIGWDARLSATRSSSSLTKYNAPEQDLYFDENSYYGPRQKLGENERLGAITTTGPLPVASGTPSFDAAIENVFRVGPFTLRTQLDWRGGGSLYSLTLLATDIARTSADFDAPSPLPGTSQGLYRQRLRQTGDSSGAYLTPQSFVRLREVALRYSMPSRWTSRAFGVAKLGLSLQARNLAIWSRSSASDPEFSGTGTQPFARFVDLLRYPTMRQLFLGVDLGI